MKKNRGIALIIALLVIMVLAILSTAMLTRSITESRGAWRFTNSAGAFWMAEAGIQRGLYEANSGGNWSGWTDVNGAKQLQSTIAGRGDYDVTVTDPGGATPRIVAVGYVPARSNPNMVSRVLAVRLHRSSSIFNYAAFSDSKITMSGQAYTNSYDSSLGAYGGANIGAEGDVGTNDDIDAGGQVLIGGDAGTGPTGSFNDSSRVAGTISHDTNEPLPPISVPENLASLASGGTISKNKTLTPGDYKFLSINLSSKDKLNITGPANIYLHGSTAISISGQATVNIDAASSGPITIYFDGNINLSGQGITNQTTIPGNLIMYGTATDKQDVNLSGQADLFGAIYAPQSVMNLSGQGGLFGSFIGQEVKISGQGGIHYDVQLSNVGAGGGRFTLDAWQDEQTLLPVSP